MSDRPWLCPEGRCTPLLNLRDGDYKDITVPEPGHSFSCWGKMAEPITFIYDGVDHTNDCNACHYTPLKGLIRWQENADDWNVLASYYHLASNAAREAVVAEQPCATCGGTKTVRGTSPMDPQEFVFASCPDCTPHRQEEDAK